MSQTYDDLLTAFAQHVGLDPAELLKTQEVVVDGITIGLQLEGDAEQGDLIFFTVLGTPDAAQLARIAPTLLQANNFWVGTGGCTIGLQRDSGAITFCGKLRLDELGGEALAAVLDGFVDTAAYWQAFVNGRPDGSDQPPAHDFMIRA